MGSARTAGGPASDIFFSSWRMEAKRRRSRMRATRRLASATQCSACMDGCRGDGLSVSRDERGCQVHVYRNRSTMFREGAREEKEGPPLSPSSAPPPRHSPPNSHSTLLCPVQFLCKSLLYFQQPTQYLSLSPFL